ncbi:hypothetical protein [Parasitella parasitica]|uniref:Uncharacterized protein n=1 Tax=Parasitella parasitica TaxID=35722 RepID=A0A0B7NT41_9FUNG|nr:hypothetical protein [Parasitella parasitica]
MQQGLVDYRQPRSVGIQCRLLSSQQESLESEYEPAHALEYRLDYRSQYELAYRSNAPTFCRSDTLLIEDPVEPCLNKTPLSLKRAKRPRNELEEDKLNDLIANWWNGSFSIPGPPSLTSDDDDNEEVPLNDNIHTIHRRNNDRDDVDYEELFRRLMNINIYAVAEYMADGEPFCLTDHIVNYFILFAILLVLHLWNE